MRKLPEVSARRAKGWVVACSECGVMYLGHGALQDKSQVDAARDIHIAAHRFANRSRLKRKSTVPLGRPRLSGGKG